MGSNQSDGSRINQNRETTRRLSSRSYTRSKDRVELETVVESGVSGPFTDDASFQQTTYGAGRYSQTNNSLTDTEGNPIPDGVPGSNGIPVTGVPDGVSASPIYNIPTGPACGDLAGTYPCVTVDGLQGVPISGSLDDGNTLVYDSGINRWVVQSATSSLTQSSGLSDGDVLKYDEATDSFVPATTTPIYIRDGGDDGPTSVIVQFPWVSGTSELTVNYAGVAASLSETHSIIRTSPVGDFFVTGGDGAAANEKGITLFRKIGTVATAVDRVPFTDVVSDLDWGWNTTYFAAHQNGEVVLMKRTENTIEVADSGSVTTGGGGGTFVSQSQNARWIMGGTNRALFERSGDALTLVSTSGSDAEDAAFWENYLAIPTTTEMEIYKISPTGELSFVDSVTSSQNISGGRTTNWSPDGRYITTGFNVGGGVEEKYGIFKFSGGQLTELSGLPTVGGDSREIVWAPNGEKLCVVIGGSGYILSVDVPTDTFTLDYIQDIDSARSAAWSYDSQWLFVADGNSQAIYGYQTAGDVETGDIAKIVTNIGKDS